MSSSASASTSASTSTSTSTAAAAMPWPPEHDDSDDCASNHSFASSLTVTRTALPLPHINNNHLPAPSIISADTADTSDDASSSPFGAIADSSDSTARAVEPAQLRNNEQDLASLPHSLPSSSAAAAAAAGLHMDARNEHSDTDSDGGATVRQGRRFDRARAARMQSPAGRSIYYDAQSRSGSVASLASTAPSMPPLPAALVPLSYVRPPMPPIPPISRNAETTAEQQHPYRRPRRISARSVRTMQSNYTIHSFHTVQSQRSTVAPSWRSARSRRSALPVPTANPITLITNADARRVRFTYAAWCKRHWARITHTSRVIFGAVLSVYILQVVGPGVALLLTLKDNCGSLRAFHLMIIVRALLVLPIAVYQHLHPVGRLSPGIQNMMETMHPDDVQLPNLTASATAPVTEQPPPLHEIAPAAAELQPQQQQQSAVVPVDIESADVIEQRRKANRRKRQLMRRAQTLSRLRMLLDIVFLSMFAIGNYVGFYLHECSAPSESPILYYATLGWTSFAYLLIFVPLTLCLSAMCCLPFVLQMMHRLRLDDDPGVTLAYLTGDHTLDPNYQAPPEAQPGEYDYEAAIGTEQALPSPVLGVTEQERMRIPILRFSSQPFDEAAADDDLRQQHLRDHISISSPLNSPVLDSMSLPEPQEPHDRRPSLASSRRTTARTPTVLVRIRRLFRRSRRPPASPRRNTSTSPADDVKHPHRTDGAQSPTSATHNDDSPAAAAGYPQQQFIHIDNPDDCLCTVCLGDYEDNEQLRVLPCGHHYHLDCIDDWMRISRVCPLCQQDIVPDQAPPLQ
ncbi:hypothetical protein RI367_001342 [Sorochytrium milnesiophthora]